MKKKINKVVKLNLKNAIVIRTNINPFEINKGSIVDFVRGIWSYKNNFIKKSISKSS